MRFGPPPRMMTLRRVGRRGLVAVLRRWSRGRACAPRTRRRRCRRGRRWAGNALRAGDGRAPPVRPSAERQRHSARAICASEKPWRLARRSRSKGSVSSAWPASSCSMASISAIWPTNQGSKSVSATTCSTSAPAAQRVGHGEQPVGGRHGSAPARQPSARDLELRAEAGSADLQRADRLVAAPPGRCGRSPSPRPPISSAGRACGSAPGNFSKVQRGILTTHVIERRLEGRPV